MKNSRTLSAVTLLALLTIFVISSVTWAAPHVVHFKSGAVTPPTGVYEIPAIVPLAVSRDRVHVLLQLDDYLRPGDREALAAAGIELLSYFPDRAYAASLPTRMTPAALSALGLRHVSPMLAEYKLHPRVIERRFGPWSVYTNGRRVFAVDVMPDVALDEARTLLTSSGFEVGEALSAAHTLMIAAEPERAYELAEADVVLFVDEAPPPLSEVNDVVRQRLHVNEVQAAPYNLSGQGVTILVYDGGMIDSTHPDFGDRVTWNEIAAVADHPTHVAGTVGGSGQQSGGTYRGMAPQARIISGQYDACVPYCLYESPNDFEDDYSQARRNFAIEITTNSIGANIDPNQYPCEWFGDYESTSRLLDGMVRRTEGTPLIMCFAAGNERGGGWCNNSSYACMSVPAGAKNIITCGATTSTDQSASFSSWGPTDDGRIKPEVSATGVSVTSCIPGGGYGDMSGTSMATPATAGTCCLILEQWHQLFPAAPDPLPETMKAILINSTTDNGPAGVDYQTGFGLVNALKSVDNLRAGGVIESSLEIGEDFTFPFTVPEGLSALDVSIAWSDVPAAGNVVPTLVNDLDIWLEDPLDNPHRPWILNPDNPGAPATTGIDTINVCERVHVVSPAAGPWTIHVNGQLNGSTRQTFGICANVTLVAQWANVVGIVSDASDPRGIAGNVSVVGGSQSVNTTLEGQYSLFLPGNFLYDLRAIAYGYVPLSVQVNVGGGTFTQDFALTPALSGDVTGHVQNQYGNPLPGTEVRFLFPNATIPPVLTNANGDYSALLPGSNSYGVIADYFGARAETSVVVPAGGSVVLNITVGDLRFDPASDGYGYFAYELGDVGLQANYDWLEISPQAGGPGTAIPAQGGNDWVATITLPFSVRYYGQPNTQARVSADGWIGLGTGANGTQPYRNVPIPTTDDPNGMICVFWDDLYPYHPQQGGDLSYYHDQANGRFIIEYRGVPHFNPVTNHVTAQVVFYDTQTRPTRTGDNEIILQYQAVDYYGPGGQVDADATIGIEDFNGADGIQVVFDGGWDRYCFELSAGYAIRFTTGLVGGYGIVQGQIAMIPSVPDITQVAIAFGPYQTNPAANGSYSVDSVIANAYSMTVTYAGYETGRADFVVTPDTTITLNYTLYRLDPARNLTGSYDPVPRDVLLRWSWPAWHDQRLEHRGERNALDALTGFEVWLGGTGLVATVPDTLYTYHVAQSRAYNFWIKAVYEGGQADTSNHYRVTIDLSAEPLSEQIPTTYFLRPNYPNPFNPSTHIVYGVPTESWVTVEVYDVLGRTVAVLQNGSQPAGVYRVTFDAGQLGSGVYYGRLRAGSFVRVQKMLLMR